MPPYELRSNRDEDLHGHVELERSLRVVGLDAADVVRRGRVKGRHQQVQGRLKLGTDLEKN